MSLQNQIKAWAILLAAGILALWVFRGILLPFIAGMGLAYVLDPIADWRERHRVSRFCATSHIRVTAGLAFGVGFVRCCPCLLQQWIGLIERLPGYATELQGLVNQWAPEFAKWLGEERMVQFQNALGNILSQGVGIVGGLTAQLMQSGLTIINALGLLIITPVVAFYLLLDWDRMVANVDGLLPRSYVGDIREVLRDIDRAMAGVIRGQGGVVLLLAFFYATGLTLTGLSFGLAIGLAAGLLSFIPYVGFLFGFALSMGVAVVQFWPDWIMVFAVFAVFIVGQFLEGNVLYPKLVGSSIGVHPVWLMFALFAFGLLFGTVGLLLAVPLAAMTAVLVRFSVRKYKRSSLYLGDGKGEDSDAGVAQ